MVAYAAPPADQVTLGVIGAGSRGTLVMSTFQKDAAVRVGAICDVYEPNLENGRFRSPAAKPKLYRNYKELLADKDIQAVLIATPEHWHAQMVLDALAAGKDVYVEKPLCHTPEQGVAARRGREEHQEHHPGRHAAPQLRPLPAGPRHRRRAASSATSAWCAPGG